MIDVDALEMVAQPGQLRQSRIAHRPVGQQAREYWEHIERAASTHRIGVEEGRNQHVAAIAIHLIDGGTVEGCRTFGRILRLHTIAERSNLIAELIERGTVVAVVSIAHTLQCTTNRDGSHIERTTIGSGRAGIHKLHAAGLVDGSCGGEVNLQVADGLQGSTNLQVLRSRRAGRRSDVIVAEQPSIVASRLHILVASKSEGEAQTRRQHATVRLSEGVAHIRQEAWQRHCILTAIANADIAQHHQQARSRLC